MNIVFKDSEKIEGAVIGSLYSLITSHVGYDLGKYAEEKNFALKNVGYEEGRQKFTFGSTINVEKFVDAMLGIGQIKIEHAVMSSSRFGIEIKEQEFSSGVITVSPTSVGECQLIASSARSQIRTEARAEVFLPGIPNLPDQYFKILIRNSFLEVQIYRKQCKIKFNFEPNCLHDMDELEKM